MISKLLGLVILCVCLAAVFLFESSSTLTGSFRIFHWPAMVLTGIGPFGIVLLCTDFDKIQELVKLILAKSPSTLDSLNDKDAHQMHHLTRQFYSQGAKALDKADRGNLSLTLVRVIERLSLRIPVQDIRILVNKEKTRLETRLERSLRMAGLGLRMSPSIGMLGTILGMVQLLSHLKDLSNIGSYMSLALLTTFYGLFSSFIVCRPLQNRLAAILDARERSFEQVLDWLQLLEERKPIQYFEDSMVDHGVRVEQQRAIPAGASANQRSP